MERGQIFGFLGPNGAGKSTTIKMLCTLLEPTAGRALVAGRDVMRERLEVRRRIGLVFQDPTLDVYLTAEENLRFHAEPYGVPRREIRGRIGDVLEVTALTERASGLVGTFSGGMKRRLEIARGLLHMPRVLLPGRAHHRPRSADASLHLGVRRRAAHHPRDHDISDDSLHGRGREL